MPICPRCSAETPEAARFCASCGAALGLDDALTIGVSVPPTRPASSGPIGVVSRRTPAPASAPKSDSGWLTSSDSISHGRFAPGALLDGRYRIVGLLGTGGMGEVYRADDLRLGQPVALKFLPDGLREDPIRLAQFHNEVRTARQVSHPNVCRVHDIGEAEGLLYISMEYVDGENLASSLRRIGRFPEDKATEITRQLCAGLAAAHQCGVIHRDLKPANVMLDGAGRVRIMDFGLAAAGRVEDVRAGTPAYMAPEQLLGREVTQRSDIFALGLVIYELFAGRRAFTAATVGDLVNQHETRALSPVSEVVSNIDPAIDAAILRCLDPVPDRRPASALSVAAALPGGDPLAALLAAGETPSPEMVAAAGEGTGLRPALAWSMLIAVMAGFVFSLGLALRESPFDRIRPEYSRDVLTQKARDAIGRLGYDARPRDAAVGFEWNSTLLEYIRKADAPSPKWDALLTQQPSPLGFWYRQSSEPLVSTAFHTDLLTPGIVDRADPPPIDSGMIQVNVDHRGRLTYFEAMPPQQQESPARPATVDWSPLFQLAQIDQSVLQPAEPQWTWLAASDTRAAWTGVWPESGRALRIEAAALGGRPVAFMVMGPWVKPWRMPEASSETDTAYALLLLFVAVAILIGAAILARKNLREGRGDRRGAARLAFYIGGGLMIIWLCQMHVSGSVETVATFLVAVCTAVFYGVLLWTVYLALEPFVRRHWPHVLVSWTSVLTGRTSDPVVGRDVLVGVALGLWFALLYRMLAIVNSAGPVAFPGEVDVLLGLRSTLGVVLQEGFYAIRNVLLYFFILFAMRMMFRREWAAVLGFTVFFVVLGALGDERMWLGGLQGLLYAGSAAFVIVRFGGLLAFVVGTFVSALLFDVLITLDTSAWYFGSNILLMAIVVALAIWGFYTATIGRVWESSARPSLARR
jgi:serine/threonine protein kinase